MEYNYKLLNQIVADLEEIKSLLIQSKTTLNFKEAARYIGISPGYLYKLTSAGMIPFSKPTGKMNFFSKSKLDEWLLSNQSKSRQQKEIEAATYISRHNNFPKVIETLDAKEKGGMK